MLINEATIIIRKDNLNRTSDSDFIIITNCCIRMNRVNQFLICIYRLYINLGSMWGRMVHFLITKH